MTVDLLRLLMLIGAKLLYGQADSWDLAIAAYFRSNLDTHAIEIAVDPVPI